MRILRDEAPAAFPRGNQVGALVLPLTQCFYQLPASAKQEISDLYDDEVRRGLRTQLEKTCNSRHLPSLPKTICEDCKGHRCRPANTVKAVDEQALAFVALAEL
jgi:hypothetical protein